ncbi:MAG: MATE family efflux transporter, partial [Clostridia bacterium]
MPYTLRKLFRWESSLVASFFQLAIPIVIQSLVMASLHIIDNVMIGQLGEMEMAAVTQANRLTFLFQLTIFGLSGATSTFVSQYWGKRDIGSIRQVQGLSLIVSGAIAILFMVLSIGFPLFVMRKFLREAPAIAMGAQYLQIVGVGYLFQALTQTYATVQKSTEQPRLPMIASIIAILTNTVLNYAFIFGRLGAPRLGIQGGAMATTIATGVEFLIVCLYGYRKKLASAAKLREL